MVGQRENKQTRHPGRCRQKHISFAEQDPSGKRSAVYCWLKEKNKHNIAFRIQIHAIPPSASMNAFQLQSPNHYTAVGSDHLYYLSSYIVSALATDAIRGGQ